MIIQTLKTTCNGCGEEVTYKIGDMTGNNEIIIDFLDDIVFECSNCGNETVVWVEKE